MRTNYLGTISMSRAFAPVLEHNGGGAVVNLLSLVVFGSVPPMSGYSASKAATASITQALRAQLADRGISLHGVFPGAIDTDMIRNFQIPKTGAAEVAAAILDGVEAGQDNIFPDPMSRAGYQAWREDPQAFERQMSSI
jgi:NAD(P)-dependent dehydrogenase (short-subunit alcohol dehydrogenase family)